MITSSTMERLKPLLENAVGGPIADFNAATSPSNVSAWDSVTNVSFLLDVEREFEIEFSPELLSEVDSIGAICEAVERLKAS